MRIITRETSPFPMWYKMPVTELVLNKRELAILSRAADILKEVEDLVLEHCGRDENTMLGVSDIDGCWGLSAHMFCGYEIADLVEQEGIRLPDKAEVDAVQTGG